LDVIASHQARIVQTVAVAGTALTEYQLKALAHFTVDVRLSFDADRAGVAATERAIPIAGKVGVSLSIIDIPSGKDPDELIRQDPALWYRAITEHKYALDWLMERYEGLLDLESAQGKREFTDILLPVVRSLSDSVEQDHYMHKIAERVGVSREALTTKLQKVPYGVRRAPNVIRREQPLLDKQAIEYSKAQDHLLALTLMYPGLRTYLEIVTPDMFAKQESRQLLTFLQQNADFSGTKESLQKLEASNQADDMVQNLRDYVKILVLEYEELYQDLQSAELEYEAARLTARLVEKFVKLQKQKLAAQLAGADEARTVSVLEQVKGLDALLKRVKGGV
jgi:DNA primase